MEHKLVGELGEFAKLIVPFVMIAHQNRALCVPPRKNGRVA